MVFHSEAPQRIRCMFFTFFTNTVDLKFIALVMYHKSIALQIAWLIANIERTAVCLISITSASRG